MGANYGKITANLAEPIDKIPDELIALINQNIKPPEPLGTDDVYVRAMFVVSDEINSFGGRFPADEHTRLASLLIDSPVLVGHRKDKLPIGRNFHSALITKDGRQWVKSYFYWLKASAGAESLRENIDGGIYKDCSIGFTYFFPECSVCGHDIRRCDHQPLSKFVINGQDIIIHFNYRQIERVLETSLVYRGALPDTSVSKELEQAKHLAPSILKNISNSVNRGRIGYQLEQSGSSDNAILRILDSGQSRRFIIRQFNINRLKHGVRFLASIPDSSAKTLNQPSWHIRPNIIGRGEIVTATSAQGQVVLLMTGVLDGKFVIQPVNLQGEMQCLFYQIDNQFVHSGQKDFDAIKEVTCP